MAAGADGGDLDAVPKLDVPPWMALAQFVPLLIIVARVLRGARRKVVREAGNEARSEAGRESGNRAARRPGEMAAVASGPFFGPGMLRALLVIGVLSVIIAIVANSFLAVRGEAPNSLAGKLGLGKGAGADLLIIVGAACIAYWATRSLTSAAWIHSVVNSIALAVAFFWSTDHGTVLHAVALVAAPFAALAVMTALSRFVGLARL